MGYWSLNRWRKAKVFWRILENYGHEEPSDTYAVSAAYPSVQLMVLHVHFLYLLYFHAEICSRNTQVICNCPPLLGTAAVTSSRRISSILVLFRHFRYKLNVVYYLQTCNTQFVTHFIWKWLLEGSEIHAWTVNRSNLTKFNLRERTKSFVPIKYKATSLLLCFLCRNLLFFVIQLLFRIIKVEYFVVDIWILSFCLEGNCDSSSCSP